VSDVLLLGASMAGVELWYQLRRSGLSLTVVDRQEQHLYIPLVQEKLCRSLRETSVLPTRAWMESAGVTWHTDEVVGLEGNTAKLASGATVSGRYVVIALGSTVATPPSIEGHEHLYACKLEQEHEVASRALVRALTKRDPHIVVVGGGITGVELAGELAHLREERFEGWFAPRVTLIDGGDRLLPHLGERPGTIAERCLTRQGVTIRHHTRLERATEGSVVLEGGETIDCDLAFWAGGVRAPRVLSQLGLPITDDGWLVVNERLECAPSIFGCGDDCRVIDARGQRWPTMQRAIECLWQAKLVARSIVRLERGKPALAHTLRKDFFHGVSMGRYSMITYGGMAMELGSSAVWFRRFLMRNYFARYEPRAPLLLPADAL
jgi:NADH dehydrogenase